MVGGRTEGERVRSRMVGRHSMAPNAGRLHQRYQLGHYLWHHLESAQSGQ